MTKITRRQRLREETIKDILDTARSQMTENGAAALSLRAIARDMGMSAPAIYRYFSNRDALVTALIGIAYESMREALEASRQQNIALSYQEQLLAVGMAYREWGITHAAEYSLIFGTPIPGYHAPTESITPIAQSALGVLVSVIQHGLENGEFSIPSKFAALEPGLAESIGNTSQEFAPIIHTALALWSHVHGFTSLELYNHLQPLVNDPAELFRLELLSKVAYLVKEH